MNGPDFQYDGLTAFAPVVNAATSAKKGLMSAADKAKLDSLTVGGGGAWTQISKTVVSNGGAGVASVDITSIPATYSALVGLVLGRSTTANLAAEVLARCNGDTGANYVWSYLQEYNNGLTAAGGTVGDTALHLGWITAANAPANSPGQLRFEMVGYAQTVWNKPSVSADGEVYDGTSGARRIFQGQWRSTAAINRLTLSLGAGNFADGTMILLYGVA